MRVYQLVRQPDATPLRVPAGEIAGRCRRRAARREAFGSAGGDEIEYRVVLQVLEQPLRGDEHPVVGVHHVHPGVVERGLRQVVEAIRRTAVTANAGP